MGRPYPEPEPALLGALVAGIVADLGQAHGPRPLRPPTGLPAHLDPFVREALTAFPGAEIVAVHTPRN